MVADTSATTVPAMPIILLLQLLVLLAVVVGGGGYLLLRVVRAMEGRGRDQDRLRTLEERILLLEETLASATHAIDRLDDEQRFTTRLLADRTGRERE